MKIFQTFQSTVKRFRGFLFGVVVGLILSSFLPEASIFARAGFDATRAVTSQTAAVFARAVHP